MDETQLIQIAVGAISGGAAGAAITALVTSHRARLLPVGKRVEVSPLFTSDFGGASFSTSVTVSDGKTDYKFPNLHLAEVQLVNRGNRDISVFNFGITLATADRVVHVEPTSRDRHHTSSLKALCTPASPLSNLDFELRPFNRGDSYTLRLFVVAGGSRPEPLAIGSSEAVRFTDIPSVSETLAAAASSFSLNIGVLEVRIPRSR